MLLTIATHAPCRVFDADGVELEYVVWANTETGEVEHLVRGSMGMGRPPRRETLFHKAPLTWEPITSKEVA